jgi:hypothetical protein
MATNGRPKQPMPRFVIDSCPNDDSQSNKDSIKDNPKKQKRSWSVPDCHLTYKDLDGAVHTVVSNSLRQCLARSRSYPNNFVSFLRKSNDKYFLFPSPSNSVHLNLNYLDPNVTGMQTPGGSSSRYSLYGSFFDLSESGYFPITDQSSSRSDNRLLSLAGHPLLIIDNPNRSTMNTFQDKCADWLQHLQTNTH